ncbi:MAG: hypoxanthine phosphoribosyltransferase [Pseudomonadota bacterium]
MSADHSSPGESHAGPSAHPVKVDEVIVTQAQIATRVQELAAEIAADHADAPQLILVGVLKGAFIFLSDLARQLSIPHSVEFIAVSSYASGSVASDSVRLMMDIRSDIAGLDVLIVEDIADSGRTLAYLQALLAARNPRSIKTCVLARKPQRMEVDAAIDYLGFDIPDRWVVGYGLDYAEQLRTLPYIGAIAPQDQ